MDDQRRRQIEEHFEAVLDLDPAERDSWLDAACAGDPDLLAEVRALLAAHELAGRLFDDPDDAYQDADRRIGPYRVVRELGRGGMGIVYLAERADGQYRRRAAIKLIASANARDPLHRRFLAERQILAGLEHPSIARLLDGGITEDGRPYLVMEYVDGLPITVYCDRHRLDVDERLRLFLDVCDAVQHAHRNLVIHRDLKPGNILITPHAQVRLLDFGIAKLINPELSADQAPVTRTEFRVMTPEYASPEQVRGDSLTTASDVYSLGVLLYELLTGSPPYRLATRSPMEILDAVCERDPERPSTRVTRTETLPGRDGAAAALTPERRSHERATTVEQLRRRLAGDLDSIVLMAMRKEPARRYGSADLLREDVARYLEGQPVLAHRGSRRYRLGKLVRRHRVEAAAAALVVASLVVGLGTATWQARAASLERDRAERALAASREVADFLMGMFEAGDPAESRGIEVTARELLERGMANAAALSAQPLVQARMYGVMGRAYRGLGQHARADTLIQRALEAHTAHLGPASAEAAGDLADLAEVRYLQGDYHSADSLFRASLALRSTAASGDSLALARTLRGRANALVTLGLHEEADSLFRLALAIQRARLGNDHAEVLATDGRFAHLLHIRGDYHAAEAILLRILAAREQGATQADPAIAQTLTQLAAVAAARDGDYARAEALHRRALAVRQRAYGAEHPAVASSMLSVASALSFQGRHDEAEPLLREGVEMRVRLLGPTHPDGAVAVNSLGMLLLRTGRHEEAEAEFQRALSVFRAVHGDDHQLTAMVVGNLGRVARAQGELDRAEDLVGAALRAYRRALGEEHPFVTSMMLHLARVVQDRGRLADAEQLLRQAEAHYLGRSGTDDELRSVRARLAELYDAWARPADAARVRALAGGSPAARP